MGGKGAPLSLALGEAKSEGRGWGSVHVCKSLIEPQLP